MKYIFNKKLYNINRVKFFVDFVATSLLHYDEGVRPQHFESRINLL